MAELAVTLSAGEVPMGSCPKSPRRFTRPQPLARLVLKASPKQTSRGIAGLSAASDALRRAPGLTPGPDYSTSQRLADRVGPPGLVDRLLGRLIERVGPVVDEVARASTGMEPSGASAYHTARRGPGHKGGASSGPG